jgi:hypothetical protein
MNEKIVNHLLESLAERKASAETKLASKETLAKEYYTGRIEAFAYAIDLIKLWAKIS